MILERGYLPSGASTKNAGFACFGSPSELLDDLEKADENTVFNLVAKRWEGLLKLRHHLGDENLDFKQWGGYELFVDAESFAQCEAQLTYLNKQLAPIIQQKATYATDNQKIKEFGFGNVKHIIVNTAEGQIDTGKMMLALTQKVQSLGVLILNAIQLTHYENQERGVILTTDKGFQFETRNLLIAVNGFAKELLPDYPVYPARAQVLITDPIPYLAIKGTFHFDKGYYYFRNIGNRLLFGGGRNLDFDGEHTSQFGLTDLIQDKLSGYLKNMILPKQPHTIASRWSGIMGLGKKDKQFIVKKVSPQIYCAVRMGGMGIAVGSLVGEEAADLILQDLI